MLFLYLSRLERKKEKIKLEAVYEENIDYFISFSMTFAKDLAKAEEAVHEAFLYVLEKKRDYLKLEKEEFVKIMLTIIRGKSIDQLRREKGYVDTSIEEAEKYTDSKNLVEEKYEEKETMEALKKHLKNLDQIFYQILVFRYKDKMTYREIGDLLNMKTKTVEMRLYRAKEKIRNKMKEEEIIYE